MPLRNGLKSRVSVTVKAMVAVTMERSKIFPIALSTSAATAGNRPEHIFYCPNILEQNVNLLVFLNVTLLFLNQNHLRF